MWGRHGDEGREIKEQCKTLGELYTSLKMGRSGWRWTWNFAGATITRANFVDHLHLSCSLDSWYDVASLTSCWYTCKVDSNDYWTIHVKMSLYYTSRVVSPVISPFVGHIALFVPCKSWFNAGSPCTCYHQSRSHPHICKVFGTYSDSRFIFAYFSWFAISWMCQLA